MSILYDEGQQAIATESRRVLDARTSKDRLLKLLDLLRRGPRDGRGYRVRMSIHRGADCIAHGFGRKPDQNRNVACRSRPNPRESLGEKACRGAGNGFDVGTHHCTSCGLTRPKAAL